MSWNKTSRACDQSVNLKSRQVERERHKSEEFEMSQSKLRANLSDSKSFKIDPCFSATQLLASRVKRANFASFRGHPQQEAMRRRLALRHPPLQRNTARLHTQLQLLTLPIPYLVPPAAAHQHRKVTHTRLVETQTAQDHIGVTIRAGARALYPESKLVLESYPTQSWPLAGT